MNFGTCPYCDDLMDFVEVPPNAPAWCKFTCNSCTKTVWRWLTRINPQAWKEEDFLETYEIDEENKRITVREGKEDVVQKE